MQMCILLSYCANKMMMMMISALLLLLIVLSWFQIHIDAHSDDDSPSYVAGMPFFRYPKTDAEVSYFMQKNDVFIQVQNTSYLCSSIGLHICSAPRLHSRHGTGSLGHRVNGSFGSSFTSGSPGHHFNPVRDPSFSGFRNKPKIKI